MRKGDAVVFVSIPEDQRGKVFVEHGDGSNRMISLYVFPTNGESDFVDGAGVDEEPVSSDEIRALRADISEGIESGDGALIEDISVDQHRGARSGAVEEQLRATKSK